jgi:hypothetical protein
MSASVVDISSRFVMQRRTPVATEQLDVEEVKRQVTRYAVQIGCTVSNVAAAVSMGLKVTNSTARAISEGKTCALQLRSRQPDPPAAA